MRIHTNLTEGQVRACLPTGVAFTRFTTHGSRKSKRAFEVSLTGSSSRWGASGTDKAATWDEWGVFLGRLFNADHDAIAGDYGSRHEFLDKTAGRFTDGEMPEDTHARHVWRYVAPCQFECEHCSAMQINY